MNIKGPGHSLTLVKGHSDFKVKTCFSTASAWALAILLSKLVECPGTTKQHRATDHPTESDEIQSNAPTDALSYRDSMLWPVVYFTCIGTLYYEAFAGIFSGISLPSNTFVIV